ncbi:hypothetical protein [Sneathiella chinensis]|uniref:Uncharacterized protein n=1 Tax=Sneathiella chinensis TaxID=349750 RepID=A0ABQ5U2S8_9PROT|nr:hypothetical protein [Sneathiella chinensis]GLQ06209.1 hypothetical protein GCM10007924_14300 [Sneathiella chinensis]
MANKSESSVDIKAQVEDMLSGRKGFANSKRLRKSGIAGYKAWLEEKLALQLAAGQTDPRKQKRKSRNG